MTDYEPPKVVFAHRLQEPPSQGKLNLKIHDHRWRPDDVVYVRADLLEAVIAEIDARGIITPVSEKSRTNAVIEAARSALAGNVFEEEAEQDVNDELLRKSMDNGVIVSRDFFDKLRKAIDKAEKESR